MICNRGERGVDERLTGRAASRYELFRLLLDDFLQTFERDAGLWSKTNHSDVVSNDDSTIRLFAEQSQARPAVVNLQMEDPER